MRWERRRRVPRTHSAIWGAAVPEEDVMGIVVSVKIEWEVSVSTPARRVWMRRRCGAYLLGG